MGEWERDEWDKWDDYLDGPDDIDPEEEDREIEARLAAYENWLGRT